MEYKYLAYQGAEFCEYDLVHEQKTKEGDGVIFELEIKNRYETYEFIEKAKNKLSYYDTAVLIVDGQVQENKIYRQDDFQFSSNCTEGEMHLCLKDVLYEIDWNKLGISPINVPVALRFGLSDGIVVTPSREGIILTEDVKKIIKKKIQDVADWFFVKYNEQIKEFDNFAQAIPHLRDSSHFLELEGEKFYLDSLVKHTKKKLEDIKVKGIENPRSCFINLNQLTSNFSLIGTINWNGSYSHKNVWGNLDYCISRNYVCVLLDQHPAGRVKEFIKTKYSHNAYFFLEKPTGLAEYKAMLRLHNTDKSLWRSKIKQVQELHRHLREYYFTKRTNIREEPEFLAYEAQQKAQAKIDKAAGLATSYKTLNKQEGEVTIAFARTAASGNNPVFEKDTYLIENLPKSSYIMVLFGEEDKEEAKKYFGLHKHLKVGIVGKRERTKLPDIHQIMTKEKFEKTKLFKRIVTAMRADNVLYRWNSITNSNEDIVNDCLEKVKNKLEIIQSYRQDNLLQRSISAEAKESFLAVAHEHSLWDMEILHEIIALEKALDTFYFLQYIEYPRYGSDEDKRRVKKMINQLLIYQKKFGSLESYELVPVAQLEEQKELEEEFLNTPEAEMCLA